MRGRKANIHGAATFPAENTVVAETFPTTRESRISLPFGVEEHDLFATLCRLASSSP